MVKNNVFDSFLGEVAETRQVMQVNTYGGHPVAAAVAVRNIEIMLEEQLPERAASMGAYLMDGLKDRLLRHGITGDVRGKGLLIGIELVNDRASKVQLDGGLIGGVVDFCQGQWRHRRALRRRRAAFQYHRALAAAWSSPAANATR